LRKELIVNPCNQAIYTVALGLFIYTVALGLFIFPEWLLHAMNTMHRSSVFVWPRYVFILVLIWNAASSILHLPNYRRGVVDGGLIRNHMTSSLSPKGQFYLEVIKQYILQATNQSVGQRNISWENLMVAEEFRKRMNQSSRNAEDWMGGVLPAPTERTVVSDSPGDPEFTPRAPVVVNRASTRRMRAMYISSGLTLSPPGVVGPGEGGVSRQRNDVVVKTEALHIAEGL